MTTSYRRINRSRTARSTAWWTICLLTSALMVTSCNKSPFDRTNDASGGGALGRFKVAGSLTVFSDELKTGGGAFEYPSGDNQSLSFSDRSNPLSQRSIRYSWNGQPVANPGATNGVPDPEFLFVGFDLMHTPTLASYASTPGRDLRAAGYTKVTFFARGTLSTYTAVTIEVAEPATPTPSCLTLFAPDGLGRDSNTTTCVRGQLTSDWQSYTIPIDPNTALKNIKDFFKATFIFTSPTSGNLQPGQGAVIYLDGIYYQP